jgi:hypothetical protein
MSAPPVLGENPSRIVLRPGTESNSADRCIDGGWWPRSLDLLIELPALVAVLSRTGFSAHCVVYRLHTWHETPRRTTIGGLRINLAGHRKQAVATVAVIDRSGQKRLELLVVPPQTEPAVARRALDIASRDGDCDPAEDVLRRARAAPGST